MTLLIVAKGNPTEPWGMPWSLCELLQTTNPLFQVAYGPEEAADWLERIEVSAVMIMDAFALTTKLLDALLFYMRNQNGFIIFGGDLARCCDIGIVNKAFKHLGFDYAIAGLTEDESVINFDIEVYSGLAALPLTLDCQTLLIRKEDHCWDRYCNSVLYGPMGNFKDFGSVVLRRNPWNLKPQIAWIGLDTNDKHFGAILLTLLDPSPPNTASSTRSHAPAVEGVSEDHTVKKESDYVAGVHDNVKGFNFPVEAPAYIDSNHENVQHFSFGLEQELSFLREQVSVLQDELAKQRANAMYWYDMTMAAPVYEHGRW